MSDDDEPDGAESPGERTDADDARGTEETGETDRTDDAADARDAPLSGLADRIRNRDRTGDRERSPDPFSDLERVADAGTDADDDGAGASTADPEEAAESGDGSADGRDPFEAMDVETVDEGAVWESLEGEEEAAATDQPEVGSGGDAERVDPEESHVDAPEHVVEKVAYCQRCQFFTDPPDVRCTHEGTTIVEVVDSEHFRVRTCPMVERGGAGSHADRD